MGSGFGYSVMLGVWGDDWFYFGFMLDKGGLNLDVVERFGG